MKETLFCFTVDDAGYPGYSTPENIRRLVDFAEETGIKMTVFAVPEPGDKPITGDKGHMEALRLLLAEGHEIGQHGLVHDRFEFGIPPQMVLNLSHEGPARERLASEKDAILENLSLEKIRARLRQGRGVLSDGLGIEIRGFRGPCISICDNLFTALDAEGYAWDSSRHFQDAGWDLINGEIDPTPLPIDRARFQELQYPGRLRTFPLTTDYTWYLTADRYEPTLALAKSDLKACAQAGIPFVPVCHVSPIFEGDDGLGLKLYLELLQFAGELAEGMNTNIKFCTLSELHDEQK